MHEDQLPNSDPTSEPSEVELLPILWFNREPETPEEKARYDGMVAIWEGLWKGVGQRAARDSKRAAATTLAAFRAIQFYAEQFGLEQPSDPVVLAERILSVAVKGEVPGCDTINPRSFVDMVSAAQEGARLAKAKPVLK